jgi:hypothetical protein
MGSPCILGSKEMKTFFLLLSAVALTSCAQQAFDMRQESQPLETSINPTRLQQANSNIGKNFWLTAEIELCPRPFRSKRECHMEHGGRASVISVTNETALLSAILSRNEREVYYFISIDSKTGYVESLQFERNTTTIDPGPTLEAEAAAVIRNARGAFVLVVTITGGTTSVASDTPDRRPYVDGSCTTWSGGATRTEKGSMYVPGALSFNADSVSCTFRGSTYSNRAMLVELHRGSAKGEIVARSEIRSPTDYVSVAGH